MVQHRDTELNSAKVQLRFGLKIPMTDGVQLNATLYSPQGGDPAPTVFTLTPYVAQTFHDQALNFAKNGIPFLTIDVRGRGNSEGEFQPFVGEGQDGYDVVEWLARQPYCNGKVGMWGGSYAGHNQWTTASKEPPHLAVIAPAAANYLGIDFPMHGNIAWAYWVRWLTFTAGRTSQRAIFDDQLFWRDQYVRWSSAGVPFSTLDEFFGNPSGLFKEWLEHPAQDEYWDSHNPSAQDYAKVKIPVLTITGIYDNAQLGALTHHRLHLEQADQATCARHYLVIGPWDHAGTRRPQASVGGLRLGPNSLVDLRLLHVQWYRWTMGAGPKPGFLKDNVAYYVVGADIWQYAATLADAACRTKPLYLSSSGDGSLLRGSGLLGDPPSANGIDEYQYDPRDKTFLQIESVFEDAHSLRPTFPTDSITGQEYVVHSDGKRLIYQSMAFHAEVEVTGFFRLQAWLSINCPDTDFSVCIYELAADGTSILLASDALRARYRVSSRKASLIPSTEPLLYDFDHFKFSSHLVRKGSRLRLTIGPLNSIHSEKNHNTGGVVSSESIVDARTVTVVLHHGPSFPSALHVPCRSNEI